VEAPSAVTPLFRPSALTPATDLGEEKAKEADETKDASSRTGMRSGLGEAHRRWRRLPPAMAAR
jgi:hypothetical protein